MLPGFGLRLVDQVLHAGHAGLLGGDEHRALVDAGDAGHVEGLVAVLGEAGNLVDDQLARVGEEDGVAIGRRALDLLGCKGAAAASDVGHHHALAGDLVEVLGHGAGIEVGVATGVGDHHHLHGAGRPFHLGGHGGGCSSETGNADEGGKEGGAEYCFHWSSPGLGSGFRYCGRGWVSSGRRSSQAPGSASPWRRRGRRWRPSCTTRGRP